VALQYSQAPAESYGVFDNHQHTASGSDLYSQYNATDPYNYDNNSLLQTTTNGAATGIVEHKHETLSSHLNRKFLSLFG